jgi:hypothetical protein
MRGALPRLTLGKHLLASCIVVMAAAAFAQASVPSTPPATVAFCDLLANPRVFDGQWIQVHGRISLAFEDFTLWEPGCDKPLARSIWLEYGGDEETPTKYCCGDHSRSKGKDISIRGQTIPLVRDAQMQEFIQKVQARRTRQANGQPCAGSLCNLYNVSATLIGLFLAAPEDPKGGSKGYGHLGCCHLFVIHRVSDVVAERTPVPLDSVSFTCTTQTWQAEMPADAALRDPRVTNRRFLAQQMRKHGDGELVDIMQNTISKDAGLNGTLEWTSPDLQTIYAASPPRRNSRQQKAANRSGPAFMTITRERCVPILENPK